MATTSWKWTGRSLAYSPRRLVDADDLAAADAAAGEEGAVDLRPVVAAGGLVDPGGPAELAPGDHRHVVEQAAGVEVFDQGAEALVELASRGRGPGRSS